MKAIIIFMFLSVMIYGQQTETTDTSTDVKKVEEKIIDVKTTEDKITEDKKTDNSLITNSTTEKKDEKTKENPIEKKKSENSSVKKTDSASDIEKIDKYFKNQEKKGKSETGKNKNAYQLNELWLPGVGKNKVYFYGGLGNRIYGYQDRRYTDLSDQGDYLKKMTQLVGIEFHKTDLSSISQDLKDIRLGANIFFNHHSSFNQKTLYAVPSKYIPEEEVFEDKEDSYGRYWLNMGFFAGVNKKWYGLDVGLTYTTKAMYEEKRDHANPEGVIEEIDGRGWVWEDSGLELNFYARLGLEESINISLSYLRENYDPLYGKLMTKIHIPVFEYFSLNIGGYLYSTNAVFLEPAFVYGDFSLLLKVGTVINYNDDDITRVGIADSLFGGLSVSYEWK